jgi:hypothetical protein
MRMLFTLSVWLLTSISANAQAPLAEKAFIITRTTITDANGTEAAPVQQDRPRVVLQPGGLSNISVVNSRYKNYQPGDLRNFTGETWYLDGNVNRTVKYNQLTSVNIYNKNKKEHVSYYNLDIEPDFVPVNLPRGAEVQVISGRTNIQGIIATDAELALLKGKIKWDNTFLDTTVLQTRVLYQDVTKEIAGYPCKRAIISLMRNDSLLFQIKVWYNTQVKLENLHVTGDPYFSSTNIYGYQTIGLSALAALPGLTMEYELPDLYGNTISSVVTKLNTSKKIPANLFNAPGNVTLKPLTDLYPASQ